MKTKIKVIMLFLALFALRANSQIRINSVTVTNATRCDSCNGKAIASVTTSHPPVTYYWSNLHHTNHSSKDSELCPGTYYLSVRDSIGDTTSSYVFNVGPAPIILTTTSTSTGCSSNIGTVTAVASGGTPPFTYYWAPGGATTATVTGLGAGTYTVTVTDHNGCNAVDIATVSSSSSLTDSVVTTNATCGSSTGSATAHASGGFAPYTYLWTPGGQTTASISGLSSGSYTVTVRDSHGCDYTNIVNVGVSGLILSLTETNVLCHGGSTGSATVSHITGGVSPFTYLWTPGGATTITASNLSAGTYSVTVTDHNGCTGTAAIHVGQPSSIFLDSVLTTGASCSGNNGTAYVDSVFGGTGPYTYLWTPSGETTSRATGLSAGTYTVTITDHNGCTATARAIVSSSGPIPTIVTGNDSCYGESNGFASVTSVSGGVAPYTYHWAPSSSTNSSITGLSAGNYTVTVTDRNGCSSSTVATIYQPGRLTFTDTLTADTGLCNGGAWIYVAGGTGPYTYTWSSHVNTHADTSGEYADSLCAGAYLLCITDAHGCTTCDSIHVPHSHLSGIGDIKMNSGGIKIYPDPVSYSLNIATDGLQAGTYSIFVYDMIGRQVMQNNSITINPGETIPVNVSGLPAGKYMLRLSGTSSNRMAPFIVTH